MTDPGKAEHFAEVYATLRQRFINRSRLQRERLGELHLVMRDREVAETELKEIEHIAHTLHGSAGTFGFTELGSSSAQAELLVRKLLKAIAAGEVVSGERFSEVEAAVDRLCGALEVV